jgi:Uma2 family endonuclease
VRVPDIAVTCAPPRDDERFFPDPVLIIEVFSPGNRRETLETVWACATIPTLVEIVLVESERIAAEVYHKDERAGWPETGQAIGADGALRLESIGFAVPLAELYAGTHLALPGS